MKKTLSLLGATLLAHLAFAQQAFEVMTKKPTPGSVITIEYMPRNTVLQGVNDFEATAYLLEGKLPRAVAVPLKKEGGIYKGSVKTADSTRAVFFSFAKEEKRDNNNDEGYYTMLYDKKGAPVLGAESAVATAFYGNGGIWDLKRNAAKGLELDKKTFAVAEAKEKFPNEYFTYLSQSKDDGDKAALKAEVERLAAKQDATETELQKAKSYYERVAKDKEKAAALDVQIKERFPNGSWRLNETMTAFRKKSLEEKKAVFAEWSARKDLNKNEQFAVENMAQGIATIYADSGNYSQAKEYVNRIENKQNRASVYNTIAWKLSGEGLVNKPKDVKAGMDFSAKSLALVEEEKKTLKNKPAYVTDEQYRKNVDETYHGYADTYAALLYHNGEYQKAYNLQAAAVANAKRKSPSGNEALAILTEKVKGPAAAQAELVKFYEDGKYTPAMKEQLKRLYTASGKTEAEWNAYAANLEQAAYNKLKEEIAKKMINMPAPQFALKNLKGEKVELAALKGKVVVVDFWATWCGPCIASFPGMQMAVKKFKDNPNVQFVFIDTWENDSNRVQKVTDFIAKNKYDFNVLYDDPKEKEGNAFVVVENFKVDGIPTKFVIDPTGNIRFKSVGFSGSADAIVSELSAMIDMAGGETATQKKGM